MQPIFQWVVGKDLSFHSSHSANITILLYQTQQRIQKEKITKWLVTAKHVQEWHSHWFLLKRIKETDLNIMKFIWVKQVTEPILVIAHCVQSTLADAKISHENHVVQLRTMKIMRKSETVNSISQRAGNRTGTPWDSCYRRILTCLYPTVVSWVKARKQSTDRTKYSVKANYQIMEQPALISMTTDE